MVMAKADKPRRSHLASTLSLFGNMCGSPSAAHAIDIRRRRKIEHRRSMNSMQIDPLWDPQLVPEASERGRLWKRTYPSRHRHRHRHSTGTGTYQKSMANACGTDGRQAGGSQGTYQPLIKRSTKGWSTVV
jgi:hypothetical protein